MKHFTSILWAGVGVALLFSGCSKSEKPVELKLKWQVGKSYANRMSMSQVAHMQLPGMSAPVEQSTAVTEDFTMSALKALPNDAIAMDMAFTSEKMETKMAGKVMMSFDSSADPKTDETNSTAPIMRQIVGAHFGYELEADGKAVHITGMDEFLARLPAGDEQGKTMLKSMLNEELVQQLAARGQGLPEKPVKIGDHWNIHLDENAGPVGILQMEMNYTFTGWEEHGGHHCVLIDFTGDVASKPGTSSGPMNVSVEKGTITGKEWIDPELGMVVDNTSDQDMTLKIVVRDNNITSQMKQTVGVRLVEVNDAPK